MAMARRRFLGAMSWSAAGAAALAAGAGGSSAALACAVEAGRALRTPQGPSPHDVARDEGFWWQVQQAFTPDRSIVNLNHGCDRATPVANFEAFVRAVSRG